MGNGYNQQHLHHQNLHLLNHKKTFLPMLCSKPSIKDVILPKWQQDSSASFSDEPLSPKISCIGQVKRNNRIVGFPASHKLTITTNTKNSCHNNTSTIKYFKLKKLFSGKNLTSSPAAAAAATTATTSCRRKEVVLVNGTSGLYKNGDGNDQNSAAMINIENMDPPLPVIKRVAKQGDKGDGVDTIWQRRSRGVTLKGLQLQQIQLNRHQDSRTNHSLIR